MGIKTSILLLTPRNGYPLDYIVNKPVCYTQLNTLTFGRGGNSGNKLFAAAMEQYLTKDDISYEYYRPDMCAEEINERYHMVVLPTANIFGEHAKRWVDFYAGFAEKLKIPIYVFGAGIQCEDYDQIDQLTDNTKDYVKRLCRAVYNTGGEFALRGYFTKEYLDRIMPNTAAVTGCPSMYQNGRDVCIHTEKVKSSRHTDLRVALNGSLRGEKADVLMRMLKHYPNAVFMDQNEFADILYTDDAAKNEDLQKKECLVSLYSRAVFELLSQNRIKLIYDVPVWLDYIKHHIDISIGYRIHGNIAAVLSGVPAVVLPYDARTKEIAEFFDIPAVSDSDMENGLSEMLQKLDYSKFNKSFVEKFDRFENFMKTHGISHDLADRSKWDRKLSQENWKLPDRSKECGIVIRNALQRYDDMTGRLEKFLMYNNKIAFYGAGYNCRLILGALDKSDLKKKIDVVFDSNAGIQGTSILGRGVVCPKKELMSDYDAILITTPRYEQEIYSALSRQGISKKVIYKITDII